VICYFAIIRKVLSRSLFAKRYVVTRHNSQKSFANAPPIPLDGTVSEVWLQRSTQFFDRLLNDDVECRAHLHYQCPDVQVRMRGYTLSGMIESLSESVWTKDDGEFNIGRRLVADHAQTTVDVSR
jgi:hypothetical protein